jgi:hypothetical protein
MVLICKRCGYETDHKHCMKNHYNRLNVCKAKYENINIESLLDILNNKLYNEKTFECKYCNRLFNSCSSKSRHKKTCKQKPINEITQLKNTVGQLITKIENLKEQPLNKNDKIILDLQYYKNRKNEKFYQLLIENYLGGTHKTLSCGITDVTTDSCHAEIKEWSSWKEAIGQLTCYNTVDPKDKLEMYMFGRYKQSCKDEAIKVTTTCKIDIYEFVDTDDGVSIISLKNNEIIYNYKPE